MSERGKYLVHEGIDGAGKSQQTKLLAERLGAEGLKVVTMFEPGSSPIGGALRLILLNPDLELRHESIVDLVFVERRESLHQIIKPHVADGFVVISDRNWFSTLAMQGIGIGKDPEPLANRAKEVMEEHFLPDGAVILDLPVDVARARIDSKTAKADRFESLGDSFFEKAREGYHWIAERYGVPLINAARTVEEVHQDIYEHLGSIALLA